MKLIIEMLGSLTYDFFSSTALTITDSEFWIVTFLMFILIGVFIAKGVGCCCWAVGVVGGVGKDKTHMVVVVWPQQCTTF